MRKRRSPGAATRPRRTRLFVIDGDLYLVVSSRLDVLVAKRLDNKARAFAEKELGDAEWNIEALLVGNDPEFRA